MPHLLRRLLNRTSAERPPSAGSSNPPPALLTDGRPWRLGLLVLNGVGQAGAATATALLVGSAFDRLVAGGPNGTFASLLPFVAAISVAALVLASLRARERADAERLGQSYVHALRRALYRRLSELAPRALQRRSHGAVMLRFVGDLTAVGQWVSLGLSRLIVGGTFLFGAMVALVFVSPPLAAGVALTLSVGLALAFLSSRVLRDRTRRARRERARLAANVSEQVASMAVVQVFGQTRRERKRLRRQSDALAQAMIDRARAIGRLRGITEGTALMASAAVLTAGAYEVGAGRSSPGTIVAGLSIVGLLVNPLRDLGRVHEYWHNSRTSLEKVQSFLDTPNVLQVVPNAPPFDDGPGRLEFDAVHLDGALAGVSATAEAQTLVAIVGPNGAGKSTLLSLAARLVDPERGTVLLDGQDLAVHSRSSVQAAVSMVGPDLPLLRGTVGRNLRYRWPDAPEEELERVRALCGLDEVLAELSDGLETRIVDGGRNLSAGQRQRIALARALVGEPRVLLLDEADANLDEDARGLTDRVVQSQRGLRTVLVVTHRPEVLEWADAIWYVEDGRLVADTSAPQMALG